LTERVFPSKLKLPESEAKQVNLRKPEGSNEGHGIHCHIMDVVWRCTFGGSDSAVIENDRGISGQGCRLFSGPYHREKEVPFTLTVFSIETRLSRGVLMYLFAMLIRYAFYRLRRDRPSLQRVSAISKPRGSRVDARGKMCQESAGYSAIAEEAMQGQPASVWH
jgi:hypothetical protein